MRILHTEASTGWGGQEIRILKESQGIRKRGHEVIFAVVEGGLLASRAREQGFTVYEFPAKRRQAAQALTTFIKIIKRHQIEIVNTHSSWDAWIGGIAARLTGCSIIRTRHLSSHIRPGLNSRILYNWLTDGVVTTCESVSKIIQEQADLNPERCRSIPTGIESEQVTASAEEISLFRQSLGLAPSSFIVGTACVLRSWKGIKDLLGAAKLLQDLPNLEWLIVGGGPCHNLLLEEKNRLGLNELVHFTGHLENPFPAIASMDLFALLSTANEGVSQASLQAAFLQRPLITTTIGGLGEVCRDGITGYLVEPSSPQQVAERVRTLYHAPDLRTEMGQAAKQLVEQHFTMDKTLDGMEAEYRRIRKK